MERRFPAALLSAVVLHVALMGLSVWSADGGIRQVPLASTRHEVEVSILVQDGPRAPTLTEGSSSEATSAQSHAAAREQGVAHGPSSPPSAGQVHSETEGDAVAEPNATATLADLRPDAAGEGAPGAPGGTPRPHIDLGLDGAIVARTLGPTEQRGTGQSVVRRRTTLAFDGWSEGVVRKVAHTAAPSDGSALLTIEWDAAGRLASIRSSAESSNANAWRKLAATLQKQLAQRPQASSRGLRLVYLLKSEVVNPGERSKLPESKNVSGQTFRDEHLPPANFLMLGVKADTSPAGQKVVSVTLANSQVL